MRRIVTDWLTRPRPWHLLWMIPALFFYLPYAGFVVLGTGMVFTDAVNGTLRGMRVLPVSTRTQATACWFIAVLLFPPIAVLLQGWTEAVWSFYANKDSVAHPLWGMLRYPVGLGCAGALYLLVGLDAYTAQRARTVLVSAPVYGAFLVSMFLYQIIDYYAHTTPSFPAIPVALLACGSFLLSFLLREQIYRALLLPRFMASPSAASESTRIPIGERIFRAGMAAFYLRTFALTVTTGGLMLLLFIAVNTTLSIEKDGPVSSQELFLLLIITLVQAGFISPALRALRSLPHTATWTSLHLQGLQLTSMAGGILVATIVSLLMNVILEPVHMRIVLLFYCVYQFLPALTLRLTPFAAAFVIVLPVFPISVASMLFIEVFEKRQNLNFPWEIFFYLALLPFAVLWTRHEIRVGRDNYGTAKWAQYNQRKG